MFKFKSQSELDALSQEDFAKYQADLQAHIKSEQEKTALALKELKDSEEGVVKQILELKNTELKNLSEAMKVQGTELKKLQSSGTLSKETFEGNLKKAFDENIDTLKTLALANETRIKSNAPSISLNIKATQTYGDIDSGEDFAQMRVGIIDSPVRRAGFVRSLFGVIPLSTEFYEYVEQDTVVRDAQTALPCEPIVSGTKETLKVSNLKTTTVKDIMKFCLKFVADYSFMASRIRKLITESLALKIDQQLLYGTGLGTETFSVNFHASEFDAANIVCPVNSSIEKATMVDLILAMQTQIEELGQQNSYMPNVVFVNRCDWFTQVQSRKDTQGNYIDSRVTTVNGMPTIGGMSIVTNPLIVKNTLFVFDSTKGEVLDRQSTEVSISTENSDDWEREFASIKALARLNFWVPNEWKNAFMKTSDIVVAIGAINKP